MAPDTSLSRVDSYQYPAAHVGHLTEGQQTALAKFKEICEGAGYYKPDDSTSGSKASHDDETLLRYLRARKFNPEEAFKQFKDTEDWRKENRLEELYSTIDIQEYEETRRLYPQWTGRRDRRGIPVYVFEVAHLNSKTVAAYEQSTSKTPALQKHSSKVPVKMLRLFALYENLTRFIMPLCTAISDRPHPETPVSQSSNIVDISRVGLKQFWNLKSHMQDASQLATAYYPETLDRIFIIGAPAFFPTVWGWIKRWFDPITVSKIFILSSGNMKSTLEKYIDPANIPKKYGGELEFEFGMMPVLEPAIKDKLRWETPSDQGDRYSFPTGPIKWRKGVRNEMDAVAVGSFEGKAREHIVAHIKSDWAGMHGISRMNTAVDWSKEDKVEVTWQDDAAATQPPEEGDLFLGADLKDKSGSVTPSTPQSAAVLQDRTANSATPVNSSQLSPSQIPGSANMASNTNPNSKADPNASTTITNAVDSSSGHSPAINTATTATDLVDHTSKEAEQSNPITKETSSRNEHGDRVGTSTTRFEQQDKTHAEGQLADGTPHITHHGHGDVTATMEPATVGQAPKEVPIPKPEEEGKGVVQQAQEVLGSAMESAKGAGQAVLGAVGMGGASGASKPAEEKVVEKKPDKAVDEAGDEKVEEFLRSTIASGKTEGQQRVGQAAGGN